MPKKYHLLVLIFLLLGGSLKALDLFVKPQSLTYLLPIEDENFLEDAHYIFSGDVASQLKIGLNEGDGNYQIRVTLDKQAELEDKPSEAFIIKIQKEAGLIAANSEAGLFYALNTWQTIKAEPIRTEFTLIDWPEYPIRGIIEGFYGKPWTHEDRLSIIDFMGQYRMNNYVYAPKDDPYHRSKWKEPYPENQKKQLQELVERAKANQVKLVFAISPGMTVKFTSEEDWQTLLEKTEAMIALGIQDFALLWDDINPTLKFKDDRVYYKNNYGLAHVEWSNRYQAYLRERIPHHKLLVVGTDYYQEGTSRYRQLFADNLLEDIYVYSTGYGVVAPRITKQNAKDIATVWGHEIVYWDNYPVNDYCRDHLYLGPLSGREALLPNTAGFTWNPMNEAELSKIALLTAASYAWNSEAYLPLVAFETAIKCLGGEQADILRRFAVNCMTGLPGGASDNYPQLWELINQFDDALFNYQEAELTDIKGCKEELKAKTALLKAELEALNSLEKDFLEYFPQKAIEGEKYLKRLSNLGYAGVKIIAAFEDLVFASGINAENLLEEGKLALKNDSKLSEKIPSSVSKLLVEINNLYRKVLDYKNK